MKALLTALILSALTGCASLAPTDLLLEQDHMSSATQHLRATPTNVGINASMAYLRWRPTRHVYVDLGEGVSYGAPLINHHPEVFQGRVGVDIPLRGE